MRRMIGLALLVMCGMAVAQTAITPDQERSAVLTDEMKRTLQQATEQAERQKREAEASMQRSLSQIQALNSPGPWVAQAMQEITDSPKCKKFRDQLLLLTRAKTFDPWVMQGLMSVRVDAIAAGCAARPALAPAPVLQPGKK